MSIEETLRTKILLEANKLTSGDRDIIYGPPNVNLTTYANLCTTYLEALPSSTLDATDGAILMVLAKISRITVNKNHRDNYVDGAAYMAIAGECAALKAKQDAEPSHNIKEAEIIAGGGFS